MTQGFENQVQTEWKWLVTADLFLAGMGAGGYAAGVLASYGGPAWEPVARTGVALGFPLLLLATFFLLLDLNVKRRALWIVLNPSTSWITRGSLIVSVFMGLSALHLGLMVWPGEMAVDAQLPRLLGTVNLLLSVLVMVYTGALMSASRPIAFWNTAMLPLLFLISAATTGTMAVVLLTPYGPELSGVFQVFARVIVSLLTLKAIVIVFYIQASHRTGESRESARLLLKGRLAKGFWLGVVGAGLLIPLILVIVAVSMEDQLSSAIWLIRTACILGLVGALILRRLILAAGVRAPLRAAGIEYTFPSPFERLK